MVLPRVLNRDYGLAMIDLKLELREFPIGWDLIDAYRPIEEVLPKGARYGWLECTGCNEKPRLWVFDNGRYASCKCFKKYGRHVCSESCLSTLKRGASLVEDHYCGELRNNWNHWVVTGEIIELETGRW